MALILENISSLYRGVTKQDQDNRLKGQVTESVNMMHSVEKGITRRNPLELVKESITIANGVGKLHSYARGDGEEEYIMNITSNGVEVFSASGVPQTVTYDTGFDKSWFSTNGKRADETFRAITVGDTTFITNRELICAMSNVRSGTENSHLNNPFYWLKRSFDNGDGEGYSYTVNGNTVNSTKTSDGAIALASALNSANSGGISWEVHGSVIVGKGKPSVFDWSDSFGSQASHGFWGVTEKLEDLPSTLSGAEDIPNTDFRIEIQGDVNNQYTAYWMKWDGKSWDESREPYQYNTIDKTTMPIRILRQADNSFKVFYNDYDERLVGDSNTASEPSFIGKSISSLFFFKNRLCFLGGENVIMSETGSYYNFFPTTVRDILDSDPIDVAVDSIDVARLQNAVPFNNNVVLFSSNGQFSLTAEKVLSPTDVSITSTTNYNSSTLVSPISLGSSIFFPSETNTGTSVREYYVDASGASNTAVDISAHADGYIPKNIVSLEGNTNNNILFLLSKDDNKSIYIYKYFNDGQERIQTAWFRWVFNDDILGMTLIDKYLYVLQSKLGVTKLSRIDFTSGKLDTVYKDFGTEMYESSVTLSRLTVTDQEGNTVKDSRSPLMYKTFKLTSVEGSTYKVKVDHKIRNRVVEKFAIKDNKFLVKGKSTEVELSILSVDDKPLEFHTYAMEANYNLRSQII